MSGQDRVIRILAGFLGTAIGDPGRTEEVMAFMPSLEALSEHHVRVLEICGTPAPDDDGTELGSHWNETQLLSSFALRPELVMVAVRGLVAAGLLDNRRSDSVTYGNLENGIITPILEVTEIGRSVLEALSDQLGRLNSAAPSQ